MRTIPRLTALAIAAALSCSAHAADIYYEIDFTVEGVGGGVEPPPPHFRGWFVTDDALVQSHGSGTLASYQFAFFPFEGPSMNFGTQYGNDTAIGIGSPFGTIWVLHTPGSGGYVSFIDGVPNSFSYYESHSFGSPNDWRVLSIFGSESYPYDHTFQWNRNVSYVYGTYKIGSQIAAVPEPETWALMLAGVAAIGAMTRRRPSAFRMS